MAAPSRSWWESLFLQCSHCQTYREHLEGQKHKKKEAAAKGANPLPTGRGQNQLRCELCDVACTGSDAYAAHIRGTKHQKVLKLHTRLGKPIPSSEPTVVSSGTVSAAVVSKPAAQPGTSNRGPNAKPTATSAPVKKVLATPKITFVGGTTLKTTGAEAKEVKVVKDSKPEASTAAVTVAAATTPTEGRHTYPCHANSVNPHTKLLMMRNFNQFCYWAFWCHIHKLWKHGSGNPLAPWQYPDLPVKALCWLVVFSDKNLDLADNFALPGEKDITPVGEEYIDEVRNELGNVVSFNCKLCECKFNDPNAKIMHLKGRRHRLQYKVGCHDCLETGVVIIAVGLSSLSRQKQCATAVGSEAVRRNTVGFQRWVERNQFLLAWLESKEIASTVCWLLIYDF